MRKEKAEKYFKIKRNKNYSGSASTMQVSYVCIVKFCLALNSYKLGEKNDKRRNYESY